MKTPTHTALLLKNAKLACYKRKYIVILFLLRSATYKNSLFDLGDRSRYNNDDDQGSDER